MTVVATGSVAFDYILTFKGRFGDHIVPGKTHIINLSFLVDTMAKRRGGVAGNYAYTLALLGHPAAVLATAGQDGAEDKQGLERLGVARTGCATLDLADIQCAGSCGGAMWRAAMVGLADTVPNPEAVIIGPNAPDA